MIIKLSNLKKETPKVIKRVGNGLVGMGGAVAIFAYIEGYPTITMTCGICGIVGKFITSCFAVDEKRTNI